MNQIKNNGLRSTLCLASLVLFSCQKKPSKEECEELTKHLVNLQVASAEAEEDVTTKLLASVNASSQSFCMKSLSFAQLRCGMNAKDANDIEQCDFLEQ